MLLLVQHYVIFVGFATAELRCVVPRQASAGISGHFANHVVHLFTFSDNIFNYFDF